jgi:hypothetical protein
LASGHRRLSPAGELQHLAKQMHRASFVAMAVGLVACDANLERTFDLVTGRQSNLVVLRDKPTQIGPEPAAFAAGREPMKVLGEWSSLCFVLRGDTPLRDTNVMDRIFGEAMGRAQVKVQLTLADGNTVALGPPMQAWSLEGKVLPSSELSACAGTLCKANLPVGSVVSKIEVSADVPLTVQGIYWSSETDLPKPPAAKSQTAAASTPVTRSSCSE